MFKLLNKQGVESTEGYTVQLKRRGSPKTPGKTPGVENAGGHISTYNKTGCVEPMLWGRNQFFERRFNDNAGVDRRAKRLALGFRQILSEIANLVLFESRVKLAQRDFLEIVAINNGGEGQDSGQISGAKFHQRFRTGFAPNFHFLHLRSDYRQQKNPLGDGIGIDD